MATTSNGGYTPFPFPLPPMSNITPFTYPDGTTYLEILENMRVWMNDTLIPEFNDALSQAQAAIQAATGNAEAAVTAKDTDWTNRFNAYMTDVNASLQALNDHAMATLANTPTSETRTALDAIYASKQWADAIQAITDTGRLSQTALDTRYAPATGSGVYATAASVSAASAEAAQVKADTDAIGDPASRLGALVRSNANGNGRAKQRVVLLAADLGADPTGATPADDAMAAAMNQIAAWGGGSIMLDGAKFLFNRAWRLPLTGEATPPVEVYGLGNRMSATSGQEANPSGNLATLRTGGTVAVLNVTPDASNPVKGKIVLDGFGTVHIHDLQLTQEGNASDTLAFVSVQKSTLIMERVEIKGHPTLWGKSCVQTGIDFGDPAGTFGFAGYGTRLTDVVFNRLRKCLGFYNAANSIRCENLTITELCGTAAGDSQAAIEFNGQNGQCRGNNIDNLIFELCGYKYGVSFQNSGRNVLYSPQFWDMAVNQNGFSKCIDLRAASDGNAFFGVQTDDLGINNMFNNPNNAEYTYQFKGLMQTRAFGASWIDLEGDPNGDGGITSGNIDLKLWAGANKQVRIYNSTLRLSTVTNSTRPVYAQGDAPGTIVLNTDTGQFQGWTGTAWVNLN